MKLGRPVVLLTGASGFVGRHIAPILQDNGWIVRRAVRRPSENADDILIPTIDAATDWREDLSEFKAEGHLSAPGLHPNEKPDCDLFCHANPNRNFHRVGCAASVVVSQVIFV